jgi:hypothetical protein
MFIESGLMPLSQFGSQILTKGGTSGCSIPASRYRVYDTDGHSGRNDGVFYYLHEVAGTASG